MKKEIKKVDESTYSTIKKLSLAMTIIGWVAFVITILGFVMYAIIKKQGNTKTSEYFLDLALGGLIVMILDLFLCIGQIVLAKKVSNVTPKMTGKQSLIINAVSLAVGLFGTIVAALAIYLGIIAKVFDNDQLMASLFVGGGIVAILAYLLETITSTVIVAQIKVKKPVKKGK